MYYSYGFVFSELPIGSCVIVLKIGTNESSGEVGSSGRWLGFYIYKDDERSIPFNEDSILWILSSNFFRVIF
jgi:hypothetical protein